MCLAAALQPSCLSVCVPFQPTAACRRSVAGLPGLSAVFPGAGLIDQLFYLTFPVFLLKQGISIVQLVIAARRIVEIDEAKRA